MKKKKAKRKKKTKIKKKKRIGLVYRDIALTFFILTLILLTTVIFFSLGRVKIIIYPKIKENKISFEKEFTFNQSKGESLAYLIKVSLEKEKTYPATGIKQKEDRATGEVILINNYYKDQPLVATTQLLSQEGVLFRLAHTVRVPAKGKIRAKVYADKPGKSGNIGPSKFTIVKLWPGLQDKIYAISKDSMKGGIKEIKYITAEDIKKGKEDLSEEIKKQGLEKIKKELEKLIPPSKMITDYEISPSSLSEKIIEENLSAKEGEEKNEFKIKLKAELTGLAVEKQEIKNLIKEKIKEIVPSGERLVEFDPENFSYSLVNYNQKENSGKIKISFPIKTIITPENKILEKSNLVGLSKDALKKYFSQFDEEIEEVKINFSPFYLRHIPTIKSKIKIKVVNPK